MVANGAVFAPWRFERLKNGRACFRLSNRPDLIILAIQGFSHRVDEPLSLRAVVAEVVDVAPKQSVVCNRTKRKTCSDARFYVGPLLEFARVALF